MSSTLLVFLTVLCSTAMSQSTTDDNESPAQHQAQLQLQLEKLELKLNVVLDRLHLLSKLEDFQSCLGSRRLGKMFTTNFSRKSATANIRGA